MILNRNIIIYLIALIIGIATYIFSIKLFENKLEIMLEIKSLKPCYYSIGYGTPYSTSMVVHTQHTGMSQSYSEHLFTFNNIDSNKKLSIFLDTSQQMIFIKKINIWMKSGFAKYPILECEGKEIQKYFDNNNVIIGGNDHYTILQNNGNKQAVNFNENTHTQINKRIRVHIEIILWRLLMSVVLSVMFYMIVNSFQDYNFRKKTTHSPLKISIFVIAFIIVITLFYIGSIFDFLPDKKSTENRNMRNEIKINYESFFDIPENITSYANDHFAFRNFLFFAYSVAKAKIFNSASLPEKVILGKKGWFYEIDKYADADYRMTNRFHEKDMQLLKSILQKKVSWMQKKGIAFYIMVPPNRNRVYDEFFPERIYKMKNFGHNRLDYYKKYLLEQMQFEIIDPSDSLQYYKYIHDVYYSTDSHWNMFGAWVAYSTLMNRLKIKFPCLQPIQLNELNIKDTFNQEGDLAKLLSLENIYRRKEVIVSYKDSSKKLNYPAESSIYMRCINKPNRDSCHLKLMLFRDSYSNYLIPYLNEHFDEIVCVWSYDLIQELIENEKPDIVLLEVQQRALLYAMYNAGNF